MVPGDVPCLLPAYFLTKLGAEIDIKTCQIVYTSVRAFQNMKFRDSGHVEVDMCDFGERWSIPQTYDFLKSELWDLDLKPSPLTDLLIRVFHGSGQVVQMAASVAQICVALLLCLIHAASVDLREDHHRAQPSTSPA